MILKRRTARAGAALTATLVGVTLVAAPQASADTSPAPQTGFIMTYVNGGDLSVYDCIWDQDSPVVIFGGCGPLLEQGPAVSPNTSPSIAKVGAKSYEVAYQGANHDLSIYGALGNADLNLPMMPGTSPAIASVKGSYDIAFQGANGDLWTTGERGTFDWHRPMDQKSSPSIMAVPDGDPVENGTEFVVAFENVGDFVEERGWANAAFTNATMAPGTTPSVAPDPSGGYFDIAYSGPGNCAVNQILGSGPAPITTCIGVGIFPSPGSSPTESDSPATQYSPQGGNEIGINSKDGLLWGEGNQIGAPVRTPHHPDGIQLLPGSTPIMLGITLPAYLGGVPQPGYEGIYTDTSGKLRFVIGSAFTSKYLDPASFLSAIDPGTNPSVISLQ